MTFRAANTASILQTTANIAVIDPGAANDFGLALWECDGGGQTCTPPDGSWIQLYTGDLATDGATYYIWYKKQLAGVGGTLTFVAGSAALNMGLAVAAWSGIDPTTPINQNNITTNDDGRASPAALPSPTVTPGVNGCTIVYVGFCDPTSNTPSSDGFTPPSGMTSRVAFFDASGWDIMLIADSVQGAAAPTGVLTGTVTRNGSNFGVVGVTLALTPSAAGGCSASVVGIHYVTA